MTRALWRKVLAEFVTPSSVPGFIVAQVRGAVVAVGVIRVLWPAIEAVSHDVVVPHEAPDVQVAGVAR